MSDPLDQPIAHDRRISLGKLKNGLQYFILPHRAREGRAVIMLAINAGAVAEGPDQRGVAHFVEHLAVKCMSVARLDAASVAGEHLGRIFGTTSADQTSFRLEIGTESPALVDKAFGTLRRCFERVSVRTRDVEHERTMLLQEGFLHRGAMHQLRHSQDAVAYSGSRYEQTNRAYDARFIKNVTPAMLSRFHQDWYRPDLATIIVVGDIKPSEIERRIKDGFSSLHAARAARRPATPRLPRHAEVLVSVETHAELPASYVSVLSVMERRANASRRDQIRDFKEQLVLLLLRSRLTAASLRHDSPIDSASVGLSNPVKAADVVRLSAGVGGGDAGVALRALLIELRRIEAHGFSTSEIERAKRELLAKYRDAQNNQRTRDSNDIAQTIARKFLVGEPLPDSAAELETLGKILPALGNADLVDAMKQLLQGSRAILVSGPPELLPPTANEIRTIEREARTAEVEPYHDRVQSTTIKLDFGSRGKVARTRTVPPIEAHEWTLGNGVRVVVKTMKAGPDEVHMTAFSPGGSSMASEANYPSAKFAAEIVAEAGFQSFDALQIRNAVRGKTTSVKPYVTEHEVGIVAQAPVSELELLFQLVHLSFTLPRRDENAFRRWRDRRNAKLKARSASAELAFEDAITAAIENAPQRSLAVSELVPSVNLDRALEFYRSRFSQAGGFTFVIVGKTDTQTLSSLAERYLGSLAAGISAKPRLIPRPRQPSPQTGLTSFGGSDHITSVSLNFFGNDAWSREKENNLHALRDILQRRLEKLLKADMGKVYAVRVTDHFVRRPDGRYILRIGFHCDTDDVDSLVQVVHRELKEISKYVRRSEMADVKELRERDHQRHLTNTGFWLAELARAYRFSDDPAMIADFASGFGSVTPDRVQRMATQLLTKGRYFIGVLKPDAAH